MITAQAVRASRFAYHDGTNLDEVAEHLGMGIAEVPEPVYPFGTVRVLVMFNHDSDDQKTSPVARPPGSPHWIGYFPGGVDLNGVRQFIVWVPDVDGAPDGFAVIE